mmetsp:Transcript_28580/g.83650  ORF Transcript_28580/g.83650 Transcript_28580/m.83650 type:complete len:363 (-) Transcript_28580:9-1097(-)
MRLWLWLGAVGAVAGSKAALNIDKAFEAFDADSSNGWDVAEYFQLLRAAGVIGAADEAVPEELGFAQFDVNGDGALSRSEVKGFFGTRFVQGGGVPDSGFTYKALDGTTKRMSKKEAEKRMAEQAKFRFEGDKLIHEESGELDATEVADKNPALALFIRVGRFAQEQLQAQGHAFGEMTDLTSSDRRTELEEAREQLPPKERPQSPWAMSQILTIEESRVLRNGKKGTQKVKYETVVRFDSAKIRSPHVALVEAWILDDKGNRREKIECPEPPPRSFLEENHAKLVTICGVVLFSAIVRMLRVGLGRLYQTLKGTSGTTEAGSDSKAKPTTAGSNESVPKKTKSSGSNKSNKKRRKSAKAED